MKQPPSLPVRLMLALLAAYKQAVSPWLPPACRFFPSCSEYAGEAVEKYGVCGGSFRALSRILRCHPFNAGGPDPLD